MKTRADHTAPFLAVTCLLMLWIILSGAFGLLTPLISPLKLPPPGSVVAAAMVLNWSLFEFTLATTLRIIAGVGLGAALGVAIGLLLTYHRFAFLVLWPVIQMLRPCPPVALVPFAILYLGLGVASQIIILIIGVAVPFSVVVLDSSRYVNQDHRHLVSAYGADRISEATWVLLPAILPGLLMALRICTSAAITLTCAAEYLGAQGGLGFLIRNARSTLNTEVIVLAVLLLTLVSWLFDRVIVNLGARLTKWVPQ